MPATPAPFPTPVPVWETGGVVGRYSLLAPIAQGGMAEIWLARQTGMKGFEKLVVVKRMTNALENDPEHVEMFLSEARLAAQLSHPHVVQIFELGEAAGSYYIAMEYLDGENLAVVRRTGNQLQRPLPDALAARLVAWGAEGLHYAHTRVGLDGRPLSIVHRDVSPQNLIVTYDGGLKVVDFGIAKAATQATMSGKLKGKLAYMAPEQARAEVADPRSDVFALGIVLFELVTRSRLLPKMDDLEILHFMSGSTMLPRPSERRPDVPHGLDQIISKAMSRKREERFQTAREMEAALEEWIRSTGNTVTSSDVADYMRATFADRIRERRALIEAALHTEMTPNTAQTLQHLASANAASGSASLNKTFTGLRGRGLSPPLLGGLVALGVALVGGVIWALTAGEPTPVPAVAPAPVMLTVDSDPGGADISIDGVSQGKAPAPVEGLSPGEHKVVASLDGYQTATRIVKLAAGEHTQVVVPLVKVPVVVVQPTPREPETQPQPMLPRGRGKLTLKTEPWTQVFLGKQKLGDTPLIGVSLPAGKHTLRLVNPDTGLDSSIEVDIKINETVVKKLKL